MFGLVSLQMHKGHTGKKSFVCINTIFKKQGEGLCQSLPTYNALIGYDTNGFLNIGKNNYFHKPLERGANIVFYMESGPNFHKDYIQS